MSRGMRLGVLSDTHGNLDFLQRAADILIRRFGVEAIVHLGDDMADALQMELRGRPLFAVPGMYEEAWRDERIPHRIITTFGGVSFLLSHTPSADHHDRPTDIDPNDALQVHGVQVLLHGHTHKACAVRLEEGLVMICPGHLKAPEDRGAPAGFAVIDAQAPDLRVKFLDLAGNLIADRAFTVSHPRK